MKKIYSIILGNNQNDLFGSTNDAILIYNLFYSFYLNNKNWQEPNIYLNNNLKIDEIIKKIYSFNISSFDKDTSLIIYFSGHSDKNGKLQFYNKFYSNNDLVNLLKLFDINCTYIIIDSCFSKNFIIEKKYKNTTKYIVSSSENQTSKEILVDYDKDMFTYKDINKKNNKMVIGIFTLYFYRIIKNKNLSNLNNWESVIINNPIWKIIERIYNQKIYFIKK